MVAGLRRFCLREIQGSRERRGDRWKRDYSSVPAYLDSVSPNRERLRTVIGVVDRRVTLESAGVHRFELCSTLETSSVIARNNRVTVHAVRWPVLDGVTAEGVLLVPANVRAGVVALPDRKSVV